MMKVDLDKAEVLYFTEKHRFDFEKFGTSQWSFVYIYMCVCVYILIFLLIFI